jgi:hypothetical protein
MNPISFLRIIPVALAILVAGCSSTTGTLSRDPVAYLRLAGVTEGHTAVVDDLAPVALMPKKQQATLQVAPGKHRIRVLSGQSVLVDRTILVSDLQTLEISVPNP